MRHHPLKIKVCGMRYAANIAEIAELKPDYLGFIFYDKSPRFISAVSSELIKYVPSEIKTVGVFVDEELEIIIQKIDSLDLKAAQLHGNETPDFCKTLKDKFPNVEIIKAFGIDENFDFSILENYVSVVDFFLFDTKTAAHGGSGKQFDWTILEKYNLQTPYFLSGGIDVEDVYTIKQITDERLIAIDLNSRFETKPGLKNVTKTKSFINAMR